MATPISDNPNSTKAEQVLRVLILGSTGSIGRQTIEVITALNAARAQGQWRTRYEVVGLVAGSDAPALFEQAAALGVRHLALGACDDTPQPPDPVELLTGRDAAERLVRTVDADLVVAAIVGFAGLDATFAAIERNTDIALANKETLVAAGELVISAARTAGVSILPIDSEHSGIWQCLAGDQAPPMSLDDSIARVTITASGGPFRQWTKEAIDRATVEQALAHPTWSMGPKVTIDCASLTNKALELIEAHWLFGIGPDKLHAVIHPQSIVHALVEFADGSTIAQLGDPDMRTPIRYAMTHPHRALSVADQPVPNVLQTLEFEEPDLDRFPALAIANRIMTQGGISGAVFNAANEAAVESFLRNEIPFGRIPELSIGALDEIVGHGTIAPLRDLQDVREADTQGRRYVQAELKSTSSGMTIPDKTTRVSGR